MWHPLKIVILGITLLGVTAVVNAGSGDNKWRQGIWKARPIPANPDGRFGKQDPHALAIGKHISTDCSIYWVYRGNGTFTASTA